MRSMTPSRGAGSLPAMLSYHEALETTCELLRQRTEGDRPVGAGDRIQEDLGLDSLAVMELASEVETRFGVSIPSDMYDRIITVEDLARAVVTLSVDRGAARHA
jgi:acyl carrier protein